MRKIVAVVALVMLTVTGALHAVEKRQATGKFEGKNWEFETLGAYAFPDEVGMDDEAGIVVAVSNSGFVPEAIDVNWDRRHVIDELFRDEDTLVVYFQFSKSGAYKGMSYYFQSGDGCGFCYDGAVKSTVKVEKGRIHGTLKSPVKPGEASFDVTFDVPVASTNYGTPLPAGGGDPGKAYAAYHAALAAGDEAAAKRYFTDEDQADFPEHAVEILKSYRDDHPTKSFRIERGFSRGDRALLLVRGENSYSKVKTEVLLVKEKGTWRIEQELMKVDLGE